LLRKIAKDIGLTAEQLVKGNKGLDNGPDETCRLEPIDNPISSESVAYVPVAAENAGRVASIEVK
jgi:hypothetical protein